MRIGVFGGSFDPVHYGHIHPIAECRVAFGLDQILYVPARRPPHKPDRVLESSYHRMAMLSLAILSLEYAKIETLELTSPEGMPTYDSLSVLKSRLPADYFLIIGSDNLNILPSWYRPRELLDLCSLIVLDRPGIRYEDAVRNLPGKFRKFCSKKNGRIKTFQHDPIHISASLIRQRRREGKSVAGLTPPGVEVYMKRYSLYES